MSVNKERIFIKQIEINNVGRFYGSHSIMLSDSSEKNITIVIGLSGRGKSTLHNLIYWGLYGEHKNSAERENVDYGLINIDALQNLSVGKSVTASVTLHLHNDKEKKYLLTREITATHSRDLTKTRFEPLNNSRVSSGFDFEISSVLTIFKDADGKMNSVKTPVMIRNEINRYFPKDLADFFLFDGEKLIKFHKKTSSDFIKDGITKISGLKILDSLSKSAEETARKIDRYIGGKSATVAVHDAEVRKIEDKKENLEKEIKIHEDKLNDARTKYEVISEKIASSKKGKDLQEQLAKASKNKKNVVTERNKNNIAIKEMLFEKIPQLLIRDTFMQSEKIFERLENEDKIPPSISRSAIDKILNSDPLKCVCGREFQREDNADSPWMMLNQIKDTIIEDGLSQGISLGRDLISGIIDAGTMKQSRDAYHALMDVRRIKNQTIKEYDAEIEDLNNQIRNVKNDDDQDLGDNRQTQWDNINLHMGHINSKNEDLNNLKIELVEARKKLDQAEEKEGKYENERKKKFLAKAAAMFAKKLEKHIEEILRNKTQKETSKYFLESAPESQTFDHVDISDNYDITVRDSSGFSSDLSKGQAHVLGLSYVAGIRKITHTDTFLIIDSPLHNISGKARNLISEVFTRYLPGVQIVLLVTDTEYTHGDEKGAEPVRNILRKNGRIWKEYTIEEMIEGGITSRKIEEYTR